MIMLARTAKLRSSAAPAVASWYNSLTFRGSITDNSDNFSYSFTPSIGAANADRYVIIGIAVQNNKSVNTATLGGVDVKSGQSNYMFNGAVPTGTTVNFSIAFTDFVGGCIFGCWTVNMLPGFFKANQLQLTAGNTQTVIIQENGFGVWLSENNITTDVVFSIDQSFVVDGELFAASALFNAAFAHREVTTAFNGDVTAGWTVGTPQQSFTSFAPP